MTVAERCQPTCAKYKSNQDFHHHLSTLSAMDRYFKQLLAVKTPELAPWTSVFRDSGWIDLWLDESWVKLCCEQYEVSKVHVLRIVKVWFCNLCAALTGVTKPTGELERCQSPTQSWEKVVSGQISGNTFWVNLCRTCVLSEKHSERGPEPTLEFNHCFWKHMFSKHLLMLHTFLNFNRFFDIN